MRPRSKLDPNTQPLLVWNTGGTYMGCSSGEPPKRPFRLLVGFWQAGAAICANRWRGDRGCNGAMRKSWRRRKAGIEARFFCAWRLWHPATARLFANAARARRPSVGTWLSA